MPDAVSSALDKLRDAIRGEVEAAIRAEYARRLGFAGAAPVRRGPSRPPASSAKAAPKRNGKHGRRSSDEIAALKETAYRLVVENPGKRAEDYGKARGVDAGSIGDLLKRLLADRKVTKRGATRATTYYPAGHTIGNGKSAKGGKKRGRKRGKRSAK